MCGNDAKAKEQVAEILRSFGWRDVIDLGDITSARGAESYLPLWLRLWGRSRSRCSTSRSYGDRKRPEAYVASCVGSSSVVTGAT
jgi:hypothetical protein